MKAKASMLLALGLVSLPACYHQVVLTGMSPGTTVVEKPWTATWLWGLVPATPIDVTQNCPSGIATVETKMTFLNGLVSGLTLGIFTPRDVKVTCASGTARGSGMREFTVAADASPEMRSEVWAEAIAYSARTHQPVLLNVQH